MLVTALQERWEARLAREGLTAEPARRSMVHLDTSGRSGMDFLATDRARPLISIEHEKLAAATWRFPFKARRRAYRNRLLAIDVGCTCSIEHVEALARHRERSERTIVRLLARGATSRTAAAKAHVSLTVVVALRRAVMQWEDPDDAA